MNPLAIFVLSALVTTISACSKLEDASLQPAFDPAQVRDSLPKVAVAANPERNLLFGDLHIHTGLSTDAFVFGVRSVPEDVYTFARGGTIEHGAGYPIQITRPLDFAAVTDHAEYMGQARQANLDVPTTQRPLRDLLLNGNALSITLAWIKTTGFISQQGFGFGEDKVDENINREAWQMTIDAAQKFNEPQGCEITIQRGGGALAVLKNRVNRKLQRNTPRVTNTIAYATCQIQVMTITGCEITAGLGYTNNGLARL